MNPLNFEVKGRFDDFIAKTFVFILRVLFEFFKIIYSSTIFPENVVSISS